jgi:hypothetical protein
VSWPPEVIELFKNETDTYDKLDPRIRWLVANWPQPLCATENVLQWQQGYGVEVTIKHIKRLVKQYFPEFEWPVDAPRPRPPAKRKFR